MGKGGKRKQSAGSSRGGRSGAAEPERTRTRPETALLTRNRPWVKDIIAIAVMYLVTLVLFWPFIAEDTRFSASGDSIAARAWNDVGGQIDGAVDGPAAWNPYVFIGFPTYGSLAYHPRSLLNPANWIVEPAKYVFGTRVLNRQVFFYFLSGLLMFLFARCVGLPWWAGLLSGLAFLLNPYNISLAEAGHGSKQWTITMMPLALLLTHRVLAHRRLLDAGLLALGFAALLLSLHAQIAYYALLVAGVYALVWFVRELLRDRARAFAGFGGFAGGSLLGLGISAFLYWPIYVVSKYSIRGVGPLRDTGGAAGLDWNYATAWSLHPWESMQFLIPGWFGLGGSLQPDRMLSPESALDYNLYWGWMPFTQSSLYMGIIPLLLAILAVVWLWKKNGIVRWMALAGVLAWVVGFGKYLPVLYGPLYHVLPFFNKFRVPSMALVVTALAVALLAGYGLRELARRLRESVRREGFRRRLSRLFAAVTVIAALGLLFAALAGESPMFGTFLKAGESQRYDNQTLDALATLRWSIFTASTLAVSLVLLVFGAAGVFAVRYRPRSRITAVLLIAVAVLVTAVELIALDNRFLHPVRTGRMMSSLAANETVRFLKQRLDEAEQPFRIFPVGNQFQSNYWMYHRIPSIGGYGANKLRVYQDMLDYALFDREGMPNLKVAGMMNARYLVASGELPDQFERVFSDRRNGQFVYDNPFHLPRAWFVDYVQTIRDPSAVIDRIADPAFDPRHTAVLLAAPDFPVPAPGDTARAVRVSADSYGFHRFEANVTASEPAFLVLSEIWYPQGWIAELDGEPVELRRVDYALRGLPVPPGEHTLVLRYDPPEIRAGFTVSRIALAVTLLLVIGGGVVAWRSRSRSERDSSGAAGG
ncbi:MAG: hypothetical protein MAG453_01638 [Calditrichaeota bacterium]|nr:hypothetical protein [Calditrichota bacterium]